MLYNIARWRLVRKRVERQSQLIEVCIAYGILMLYLFILMMAADGTNILIHILVKQLM